MKKITLVCVGNVCHDMMKFSVENTLKHTPDIEDVLIMSDRPLFDYGQFQQLPEKFDKNNYQKIMIKDLHGLVKTEFVLICQYDGMAVNGSQWSNDFYNYDYVGAPWPLRFSWLPADQRVGNGGFSLRSHRLLEALQDEDIGYQTNEDVIICQTAKKILVERYQINYAPVDLADKFSNEWNNPDGAVFGFHGIFNFPRYFDDETCADLISKYHLKHWYSDQLQNFLEYCESNNYIKTLLQLEQSLKQS